MAVNNNKTRSPQVRITKGGSLSPLFASLMLGLDQTEVPLIGVGGSDVAPPTGSACCGVGGGCGDLPCSCGGNVGGGAAASQVNFTLQVTASGLFLIPPGASIITAQSSGPSPLVSMRAVRAAIWSQFNYSPTPPFKMSVQTDSAGVTTQTSWTGDAALAPVIGNTCTLREAPAFGPPLMRWTNFIEIEVSVPTEVKNSFQPTVNIEQAWMTSGRQVTPSNMPEITLRPQCPGQPTSFIWLPGVFALQPNTLTVTAFHTQSDPVLPKVLSTLVTVPADGTVKFKGFNPADSTHQMAIAVIELLASQEEARAQRIAAQIAG